MVDPLRKPSDKADRPESAPDSVSRSVVREGAQAAARNTVKTGRSCCRSRTPSFADRVAAAVPTGFRRNAALASLRSSCLSYG